MVAIERNLSRIWEEREINKKLGNERQKNREPQQLGGEKRRRGCKDGESSLTLLRGQTFALSRSKPGRRVSQQWLRPSKLDDAAIERKERSRSKINGEFR